MSITEARRRLVDSITMTGFSPHVRALSIKLNQASLIDAIHREAGIR